MEEIEEGSSGRLGGLISRLTGRVASGSEACANLGSLQEIPFWLGGRDCFGFLIFLMSLIIQTESSQRICKRQVCKRASRHLMRCGFSWFERLRKLFLSI